MPNEPLRILAVDDVRENLIALEAALDQPGVELVTASSGFEALELLLRQDFALALLDVQMPEMDGFELAELMRGTERTRGVPIIFLTAVATDERRKFRGFETGAVDYLLKPIDITVLNSKVTVFVELARQRREIAFQRDELGAALGRLRAHGDNSPMAVLEIDSSLRIVGWYKGAERTMGYTAADMLGVPLSEAPFLPPNGGREAFLKGMGELLEGGDRRAMQEHRYRRADGSLREGEWYCSSLAGTGLRPGSVMIEMLDITERRRAEDTQRLLIGELNHRVKNTLATVQAIASQGFRHARSHREFQDAFTGRLQALARAHSMLSATTWESASLRRLIADHVAIGALSEDRLLLDGPDADLPPELALRFSLVFHELATNAHKYGAFSNAVGTVRLAWTVTSHVLAMEWSEHGGPPVSPPERRGFGSTLIEHSMVSDGARIVSEFAPEGVRWSMVLPLVPGARVVEPEPQPVAPPPVADAPASMPPMRILVVEDEPLVAMELIMEIEDGGCVAIGPATSCEQALAMIREAGPDLALLDGNLNGEKIDPVADALAARDTPFAFVSGYDREHLPRGHADRPMLNKPFVVADVRAMLLQLAESAKAPIPQKLAE
ncbi:signal transduction histidine kinase [Sphingomonas sp. LH128]|uniref:histidine kinase n=1 Tax=Novosphingobium resinovorum TaxID=158500 RepID=A0A031K6C6_9SPHN|nr:MULTISPECIES: response regulator [Sphingomonadaceae]EJU10453.1 signal transduction histidine kinase [Sphingomonas sp. LH128]EZP84790.1 Signal transduction histidine kinase [Novosphingobium resinovorum]